MRRLVLFCSFWIVPSAFGWGPVGHDLVARLAAARLSPRASAEVARILGPDVTLASISSWADQIRNTRKETGTWHYVDIQITDSGLNRARDCKGGDCILAKIEEFTHTLKDKKAPPEKRREALLFVVHFIGDMHQPLHCSDNHDKGGNDVKMNFLGRPTNLHSLWDSGLLARMGTEDALFAELNKDLTPKRAKNVGKGKLDQWADQGHRVAQVTVYGKLPKAPAGTTTLEVGSDYQEQATPVVKEQLEKGGARLAKVLNSTLK